MKKRTAVQLVDFFSGCGGMSYGFVNAQTSNVRFEPKGALDIDPYANATYRRMLGKTPVESDISKLLSPNAFNRTVSTWELDRDKPLVVIGCAPCQGFSSHRKKDHRTDNRNTLLDSFARICVRLRPDVIVMENVPEMLHAKHWRHFEAWRDRVERAGYRVRARIYNLAQFGVPQERFRAVVIASRIWEHFSMPIPKYTPSEFVTVRQAISRLRPLRAGGIDPVDSMHLTSKHRPETVSLIRMIPHDGGSRKSLPKNMGLSCWENVDGFRDVYGRLFWDRPAVAITARCRTPSCGRFVHPEQDRGLSVREAALLQGFPMDYHFDGPFDDKFKQVGNAVSPIFSEALALHIDSEWCKDHSTASALESLQDDVAAPFQKSFSSAIAGIKRRLRMNEGAELMNV